MKQIGCRDLGGDCDFVARGETNEKVKKALWAHVEKDHAKMMRDMTPEKKKDMTAKIERLLKEPARKPAPVM